MSGRWARAGWIVAGVLAGSTGILTVVLAATDDGSAEPTRDQTVTQTVDCTVQPGQTPDASLADCTTRTHQLIDASCVNPRVFAVDLTVRRAGEEVGTTTAICPTN